MTRSTSPLDRSNAGSSSPSSWAWLAAEAARKPVDDDDVDDDDAVGASAARAEDVATAELAGLPGAFLDAELRVTRDGSEIDPAAVAETDPRLDAAGREGGILLLRQRLANALIDAAAADDDADASDIGLAVPREAGAASVADEHRGLETGLMDLNAVRRRPCSVSLVRARTRESCKGVVLAFFASLLLLLFERREGRRQRCVGRGMFFFFF